MKLSKIENIHIINAFKNDIHKYGWNIGRLFDDLVIQHQSFHFVINSADELVKIIEMFSCIPAQKTKDEWHDKAKKQLHSIEYAKRLLADYKSPITCKYDHMGDIFQHPFDNKRERMAENHSAGF